ncbi:MAG: N-acetylmuramoyl-L-alanine amidase [Prevotella sp.]|nr:N-acetylmuramoyl-L-alanine amidase [Prevotella sp.]
MIVAIGTPHRLREPGKQSPDHRLRECIYGREIASELKTKLEGYGVRAFIDIEALDLPLNMQTPNVSLERSRELNLRVNYVNNLCREYGSDNVIYVSIHNDAMGADGKWHDANGWSVRVSTKASAKSKMLAECIFDAASDHGFKVRKPSQKQKYWPQNLKVLNDTDCPAVLTENLFQDNKADVDYLLSEEGRHNIVRIHLEGILRYIEKVKV